jgi:hypothetical protein
MDDTSLTFEAHELDNDAAAAMRCLTVLDEHRTATFVTVWCGERQVCARQRSAPELETPLRRRAGEALEAPGG